MPFLNKDQLDQIKPENQPSIETETKATPEAQEQKVEQADFGATESERSMSEEKEGISKGPVDSGSTTDATAPAPIAKSEQLKKIENIMQDGLGDLYSQMNERQRLIFKTEGERSARQIESILQTGKSVAKKILGVLQKWLGLIPGINKFFIEQEAKIKTDKIIEDNLSLPK